MFRSIKNNRIQLCDEFVPKVDAASLDGPVHSESYQHPDDKNMKLFVSSLHTFNKKLSKPK